jgi:hypothetical protein
MTLAKKAKVGIFIIVGGAAIHRPYFLSHMLVEKMISTGKRHKNAHDAVANFQRHA